MEGKCRFSAKNGPENALIKSRFSDKTKTRKPSRILRFSGIGAGDRT